VRVAIVGAGPAGIYATEALLEAGDVNVDVFDALPTPFGLVRYGVAPDHLKIKSIERTLRKVLEQPTVRFVGNVNVGSDISLSELRTSYDAVIYAFGASRDRKLGIPGEDLPGSISATDFVAWYSGHPDATIRDITLHARSVVVVGVGNVAVDVTRMLAKTDGDLESTDVPRDVLDVLRRSAVTDIHVLGRRSAAHAKFTTKELRELGEIANADVLVDAEELSAGQEWAEAGASVRRNLDVLAEWAQRTPQGRPRRIHFRFMVRPTGLVGTTHVEAMQLERTRIEESGQLVGAGALENLETQLVLRSVGYRGVPLAGLPFDHDTGTIPNDAGRVLRDGTPAPGEYVAGWVKRGPTGVIGTNRSDAAETVRSIQADWAAYPPEPRVGDDDLVERLRAGGVPVVLWDGWLAIEAAEQALGARHGHARIKLPDRGDLLAAVSAQQHHT
jgi:ferredoxin/flavodoxin---NADP+ reductase